MQAKHLQIGKPNAGVGIVGCILGETRGNILAAQGQQSGGLECRRDEPAQLRLRVDDSVEGETHTPIGHSCGPTNTSEQRTCLRVQHRKSARGIARD